ncbi:Maspardin [Stylophora pistillata]|uniref:Maspardin n=1 Tax=Stylophora pistillata TaxID=50429 RepID=A0A2B4SDQ0_STYPI|nr:Maspardin [Stylophora pistillata]
MAAGASAITRSQEYISFRSSVPLRRIVVDIDDEKEWLVYDAGPRVVQCPLICLPPASGTADVFFKQILTLSSLGYRVISVHIFGASLGGFLAQKFAEMTYKSPRVHSLILCNAFADTSVFQQTSSASTFWVMPAFVLKKMIMNNFTTQEVDEDIADSIDFMVERLESLGRSELASRLTLNCLDSYVEPQKLAGIPTTIIDPVKEELYKCYPDAKRAHLKKGGNFPYLCRSADVNLYLQIHLRQFMGKRFNAMDPKCMTEEDMVSCGLLPSADPPSVVSSDEEDK